MIFGKVQIFGALGSPGGLGLLFKARDELGLWFAVKFAKSGSMRSASMLEDEARRVRRYQGPNVVKYLGRVRTSDGRTGLAFELMEGDLTTLGRCSPAEALFRLEAVINALAGVHATAPGFHGDLKRANILIKGRTTKLADFGLARGGVGQTVMYGPHDWGTPGYFPPEGYSSQEGDLYSLGACFWAMLSGREPQPNEKLGLTITNHPKLQNVVNRLLSENPMLRPTVRELLHLLPGLKAEAEHQAKMEAEASRETTLWTIAAVALVAVLVGSFAAKK